MGEAQEALEAGADRALEAAHARRIGMTDLQALERLDQALGEHQQRRLLEVRDQEQQEVLVAELRQHAALAVGEIGRLRIAHHHQRGRCTGSGSRAPRRSRTRSGRSSGGARSRPDAGSVGQVLPRLRVRRAVCGPAPVTRPRRTKSCASAPAGRRGRDGPSAACGDTRSGDSAACPALAEWALASGCISQAQCAAMRGARWRSDVGQERLALVRIGARQHRSVAPDQAATARAVQRAPCFPARRVGAACASAPAPADRAGRPPGSSTLRITSTSKKKYGTWTTSGVTGSVAVILCDAQFRDIAATEHHRRLASAAVAAGALASGAAARQGQKVTNRCSGAPGRRCLQPPGRARPRATARPRPGRAAPATAVARPQRARRGQRPQRPQQGEAEIVSPSARRSVLGQRPVPRFADSCPGSAATGKGQAGGSVPGAVAASRHRIGRARR